MMSNRDKEQFCTLAAALLAPPDAALAGDLEQEQLHHWLADCAKEWNGDKQLMLPLFAEADRGDFLACLRAEYVRLFEQHDGMRISLIESTYKPWTTDKSCGVGFAASTGLLMGDSAVHMLDLYRQSSVEIPREFRSMPDHVVLELEFLALLYQAASEKQIKEFIRDHLDWLTELQRKVEEALAHPFYRNSIALINLFLEHEATNGKATANG